MKAATTFKPGDLVTIGDGGRKVYRVRARIAGNLTMSGRPMYTLTPAGTDHPRGAVRLQDALRRFAFDELRAVSAS
ncbi:hypothetical protein SEA_BOCK_65 [Gordonia phage Bock]|nr:hypothetical protein SEA_BOCK_65 [Gordonia phage Bock]